VQIGVTEVCLSEVRAAKVRAGEVHPAEVVGNARSVEVGPEPGVAKVRPGEVRPGELRATEVRRAEIRTAEVGIAEVGLEQGRLVEVCVVESGVQQVGALEVRTGEHGPVESGRLEILARQVEPRQVPLAEIDSDEARLEAYGNPQALAVGRASDGLGTPVLEPSTPIVDRELCAADSACNNDANEEAGSEAALGLSAVQSGTP
jgi:hypothetical protein